MESFYCDFVRVPSSKSANLPYLSFMYLTSVSRGLGLLLIGTVRNSDEFFIIFYGGNLWEIMATIFSVNLPAMNSILNAAGGKAVAG